MNTLLALLPWLAESGIHHPEFQLQKRRSDGSHLNVLLCDARCFGEATLLILNTGLSHINTRLCNSERDFSQSNMGMETNRPDAFRFAIERAKTGLPFAQPFGKGEVNLGLGRYVNAIVCTAAAKCLGKPFKEERNENRLVQTF